MILREAENSFISASGSSVQISETNNNRKKVIIVNESNRTLYLGYGQTAVVGQGIPLKNGDVWVEDVHTGAINGVWQSGAKNGARVIEIFE